jgi:hypothetical protein
VPPRTACVAGRQFFAVSLCPVLRFIAVALPRSGASRNRP